MTQRLRTPADGAMSTSSMWIGFKLTWCRLLAVAHHKKLCLRVITSQAVRPHKCFDVSYAFTSAFTRPGLLSLIRVVRDVELRVVRIVVRPEAVSGGG